jgi:two-component system, OmpR family, response regulator CpxR
VRDGPILIIDDDFDIRELLAETLAGRGFDVVTASNGLEALSLLKGMTAPPSAILLDLMMPVLDGYGFLEERQKDVALASIPVAVITAGSTVDETRLGHAAPILRKPFDVPRLVGILQDLRSGQAPHES